MINTNGTLKVTIEKKAGLFDAIWSVDGTNLMYYDPRGILASVLFKWTHKTISNTDRLMHLDMTQEQVNAIFELNTSDNLVTYK